VDDSFLYEEDLNTEKGEKAIETINKLSNIKHELECILKSGAIEKTNKNEENKDNSLKIKKQPKTVIEEPSFDDSAIVAQMIINNLNSF
jgi:hypothetical protein